MDSGSRLDAFFGAQSDRVTARFGTSSGIETLLGDKERPFQLNPAALRAWSKDTQRAIRGAQRMSQQALIRSDPEVGKIAFRWASLAAPAVADTIVREFVPIANHARTNVPRRSGRTADSMILDLRQRGDGRLETRFASIGVRYIFQIRYSNRGQPFPFAVSVAGRVDQLGGPTPEVLAQVAREMKILGEDPPARVLGHWKLVNAEPKYKSWGGGRASGHFWSQQVNAPFKDAVPEMRRQIEQSLQRGVRR